MQSAWHWPSLMSQFAKHSEVVCPLATSASPSQIPIATRRIANERDVDERINADESESAVAGPSLLITEEERTTNEGERKGKTTPRGVAWDEMEPFSACSSRRRGMPIQLVTGVPGCCSE